MPDDIEVQEERLETAKQAAAVRHGAGCVVMMGEKAFALDAETAMRLAWDLCVMFQDARAQPI
jgi:hypothetical protein